MPFQEIRASSAIERVGYNADTRRLSIWFKGGPRYIYSDVPAEVYEDLCRAGSAGRYVCQCITGKFDRIHPERRAFDD